METVADPDVNETLDQLEMLLGRLGELGVDPYDHRDGATLVKRLAVIDRKVESVQVELMDAVDRSRCYAVDGHASAKIFVRHHAKLSNGEAAGRAAVMKALRGLPALAAAYEAGEVGSCQVRRLARVYANKRVRETLVDDEKRFIDLAEMSSFKDFDIQVGDWVRRVDEDGTADRSQRTHENRDAKIVQDFEGAWALTAGWGSLQGNIVHDILKRFIDAEFKTDWAKALTEHGQGACLELLERTDSQRRADALLEVFMRAATNYGPGARPTVVTNIVVDQATFERETRCSRCTVPVRATEAKVRSPCPVSVTAVCVVGSGGAPPGTARRGLRRRGA